MKLRRLFVDIENIPAPRARWTDLLIVGYALDDEEPHILTLEWDDDGPGPQAGQFLELLADPTVVVVSHSGHDTRFFAQLGRIPAGPVHDTLVMAWLVNENTPLDLDWLANRYSNIDMDKRLKRSGGRVFFRYDGVDGRLNPPQMIPLEEMKNYRLSTSVWSQFQTYNADDVESLRTLYWDLHERLDEGDRLNHFEEEEAPYSVVLRKMETRGLPVDLEATTELATELQEELESDRLRLLKEAGLPGSFNLNSQPQLAAYLFSRQARLAARIHLDEWEMGTYKSCVVGDHDECDKLHTVDLATLPGFTVERIGREYLDGYWSVKGRNLAPTPPPVDKVTGKKGKLPSTSSPELLYMHASDPWVRSLCTGYRKIAKLLSTYLLKFPKIAVEVGPGAGTAANEARPGREAGSSSSWQPAPTSTRLFGHFNQAGTVTGRLSSSAPNLQNQPSRGKLGKRVRGLFRGRFVIGDYDQIEMRLMAHFSQDRQMLRIFREGLDPHNVTVDAIFGAVDPDKIADGAAVTYRDAGKQLNYAMGYGARARRVAQTLSLFGFPTTPDTAGGYLAEMEAFYRGYFRWVVTTAAQAKKKGNVRTIGGRVRHLRAQFKDTANWKLIGYGERQAVNTRIQGSAADIIRRGMVLADAEFPELGMLAQVHDEVVWEYYDDPPPAHRLASLSEAMEVGHRYDLRVPLGFKPVVADTWAEKSSGGADWWQVAISEEGEEEEDGDE